MKCPHCKTVDLSEKIYKNVKFDMCDTCMGFWFDNDELPKLLDVAANKIVIPKDARFSSRNCPRCSRMMLEFKYPQTYCYIDMCRDCRGFWLDSNELDEIKTVRKSLEEKGQINPEGVKGSLLDFINSTLDSLIKGDQI